MEINNLRKSPIEKTNIVYEFHASEENKQRQQSIKSSLKPMNINMEVNNINNFNSNIHANIISNTAGPLNKYLLDVQSD